MNYKSEYIVQYWANGQHNYDVTVQAKNMPEALAKAPQALKDAGHTDAVEHNEWQVLYND